MSPLPLLNWVLLSTALLGAWWLCYRLALRPERSFAYNRAYLTLGPLLATGLPLLPLAWPAGWWGTGPTGLAGIAAVLLPAVQVTAPDAATIAAGPDWSFWLLIIYLAGAALMLARLAYGLARLWHTARRLPRVARPGYTLIETYGQLPTSSFGRVVFWDETLQLSPAEARQVLRHELAHVQQGHTYDRLLLELLRAALWFNPFVHLCGRALALTHEYLADEAALHDDSLPVPSLSASYSQLLARQVASRLGFSVPLAHSFSQSQTLNRIAMIQRTNPIRRWKQWLALPLLATLLLVVACERNDQAVLPTGAATATQKSDVPPPASNTEPALAPPPPPGPPSQSFEPNTEKALTTAQLMPQYPGGLEKLMQDVIANLRHATSVANSPVSGNWFVRFTVGSDGKVRGVKVQAAPQTAAALTPAEMAPSEEAIWVAVQVLQQRWTPGAQDGRPVAVDMVLPLVFK